MHAKNDIVFLRSFLSSRSRILEWLYDFHAKVIRWFTEPQRIKDTPDPLKTIDTSLNCVFFVL